jgi:hypothetical protein
LSRSNRIVIEASATAATADCPNCGATAGRVHGRYQRVLRDAPLAGTPVAIRLTVRRFICEAVSCQRRTSIEKRSWRSPTPSSGPWSRAGPAPRSSPSGGHPSVRSLIEVGNGKVVDPVHTVVGVTVGRRGILGGGLAPVSRQRSPGRGSSPGQRGDVCIAIFDAPEADRMESTPPLAASHLIRHTSGRPPAATRDAIGRDLRPVHTVVTGQADEQSSAEFACCLGTPATVRSGRNTRATLYRCGPLSPRICRVLCLHGCRRQDPRPVPPRCPQQPRLRRPGTATLDQPGGNQHATPPCWPSSARIFPTNQKETPTSGQSRGVQAGGS